MLEEAQRVRADGELADKRFAAEAARGARFREFYVRLGLRAAVHADRTKEITMGATSTKGVMHRDKSSYALYKHHALLGRPELQVLFHEPALLDALLDLLLEPQVRCSYLL
jgi:hypothetical protein